MNNMRPDLERLSDSELIRLGIQLENSIREKEGRLEFQRAELMREVGVVSHLKHIKVWTLLMADNVKTFLKHNQNWSGTLIVPRNCDDQGIVVEYIYTFWFPRYVSRVGLIIE